MFNSFRKSRLYYLFISLIGYSPILANADLSPKELFAIVSKGRKAIQDTIQKNSLYKEYQDEKGGTFLIYSVYNDDLDSIKYLIETVKVNVNQQDKAGNTALMAALRNDGKYKPKIKIAEYLVKEGKADVTIENNAGDTPLFRILRVVETPDDASKYEDQVLKMVKTLVAKEKFIVTQSDSENFTPLMSSISRNCQKIATFFIKNGANVDAVDADGNTSVFIATVGNNIAMLNLLVNKYGAKINPVDKNAKLPLMVALHNRKKINKTTVEWLINNRAKANILVNGENPVLRELSGINSDKELIEVALLFIEKEVISTSELLFNLLKYNQFGVVNQLLDNEKIKKTFNPTMQYESDSTFLNLLINSSIQSIQKVKTAILEKLINQNKINLKKQQGHELMLQAARTGNFKTFAWIGKKGKISLINWPKKNFHQILGYSGSYGQEKLWKKMLEENNMKGKLNLDDHNNLSMFLTALFRGSNQCTSNKIMNLLSTISKKKKIDLGKASKQIILLATQNGQYQVAEWLEEEKLIQWNSWTNQEFDECLRNLAKGGKYSFIHNLFSQYPAMKQKFDPTSLGTEGKTFLDYFIEYIEPFSGFSWGNEPSQKKESNKLTTLKFLAGKGIIDLKGKEGDKVFLAACAQDVQEIVEYMLEENLTITTSKNDRGQTGIMLASLNGHDQIINIVGKKASQLPTEEEDQYDMTPLMAAGEGAHLTTIQALLSAPYNAQVDYQSKKKGKTLLMVLAGRKERGSSEGNYPAPKYSEQNDLEIIKYLIENYKLNTKLTDKNGNTAYDLAKEANNKMITCYFEQLPDHMLQSTNSSDPNLQQENHHKGTSDNAISDGTNNSDMTLSNDSIISTPDDHTKKLGDDDLSNKNIISKNFEWMIKIAILAIAIVAIALGIPYYLAKRRIKRESSKV